VSHGSFRFMQFFMSDIPSRGCSIVVSNEVLKEKLHIGSKQIAASKRSA